MLQRTNYRKGWIVMSVLFMLLSHRSYAQTYYNEWINYSQTYYKFKIGTTGLCRIPYATLQNVGIASTNPQRYQLWRNGQPVPLYVNISSNSGYIEFWAVQNDGKPDRPLYKKAVNQINDFYSLETDTASYYLTINDNYSQNKFLTEVPNVAANVTGGIVATPYFMDSFSIANPRNQINPGKATTLYGDYVYSSTYDIGEGLTSDFVWAVDGNNSFNTSTNDLFPYLGNDAPIAALSAAVIGCSGLGNNRTIRLNVNSQQYDQKVVNYFDVGILTANVTASQLQGTLNTGISITSNNESDRIVVSYVRVAYPRLFNFRNKSNYSFSLPANASGNYIEVTELNSSASTPVLYDLTNGKRYVAVNEGGKLKFYLQPSLTKRQCLLTNEDVNTVITVNQIVKKNFVDYTQTANQGDYLIISHKNLMSGTNPVNAYRQYRSSAIGGNYNAHVYDMDDLEDQFAYGIHNHPLSVKNFLLFANNVFGKKPTHTLLIGRGVVYSDYYFNQSNPTMARLSLIPTFGAPASDVLLSSANNDPLIQTQIGRIPAITPAEVTIYLNKLKEYEAQQASTTYNLDEKLWMKNVLHVSGASDASEESNFTYFLRNYESILKKPHFGGTIYNFNKSTGGSLALITDQLLSDLFASGFSVMNYFGHASSEGLNYNLNDPENYHNKGKYPIFFISGCDVAGYYSYDERRLTTLNTIPDKYTFIADRGTIAFLCQSGLGVPSFLNQYNTAFWNAANGNNYGKTFATSMYEAAIGMVSNPRGDTIAAYGQAEECLFLGDPAIRFNSYGKPDYTVESPQIVVSPSLITVADNSFHVKAYIYNIGKATNDSLPVQVKRQYPDGTVVTIMDQKIAPVFYKDSIELDLPIVANRDKGQSNIIITLDPDAQLDELSETNNTVTKSVFIYDNGLTPIFPYAYSIVRDRNVKLIASTSNPLAASAQYVLEMDTTKRFNSRSLVRKTMVSGGGVLEFVPGISFVDSTVYYWRVAAVPTDGREYSWNTSSFQFIAQSGGRGFNQSHLYQHLDSDLDGIGLDTVSRQWNYNIINSFLEINHGVFPYSGYQSDFSIFINRDRKAVYRCIPQSITFNVFDPNTLRPYYNQTIPSTNFSGANSVGFMGTANPCVTFLGYTVYTNFEFPLQRAEDRQKAVDFMNWIPRDAYVIVRLFYQGDESSNPSATIWKNDPLVNGSNLFSQLQNAGFGNLSDYSFPRSWVFVYKKENPTFIPIIRFTDSLLDKIILSSAIPSPDSIGYIKSPKFGPSKMWKNIVLNGKSLDSKAGDNVSLRVYGINKNNNAVLLKVLNAPEVNTDISDISAATYPYLQLEMRNADSINYTPYQLKYWKVLYDPAPEGALAANLYYSTKDTIQLGEPHDLAIAFKNVSDINFSDSIPVNYSVFDKGNREIKFILPRIKPVAAGDTTIIRIHIPSDTTGGKVPTGTANLEGYNNQYLDVNPLPGLEEQTHINNFLYKSLNVLSSPSNTSMDVTFDGVHILNNDIVAAHPLIKIQLEDNSTFLLLNDTSMVSVQLKYPDETLRRFYFNNDTMRFSPAIAGQGNKATVDFNPALLQDGMYQLYVTARNAKNGDKSFSKQYSVPFQVINKPMISDVFNYPNPFTTSTAFVFTLTGSQVPQNIRIQILTITGKIVKEITKEELGPLHVGRNVTEYKWDGTDGYGQSLANGVYLYRIITNNNAQKLSHFNVSDEDGNSINTSRYFKGGYGKMYLMR